MVRLEAARDAAQGAAAHARQLEMRIATTEQDEQSLG